MRQAYGLSEDGSRIILERFTGGVRCGHPHPTDEPLKLLVVDVETTGLDPEHEHIIEFAAADLLYTDDGRIIGHTATHNWMNDPGDPIPDHITEITGITDEDVEGQRIPDLAEQLLADADLIISHNAAFDWSFCRKRWPDAVDGKVWACSLRQIDWNGWGFPVAKQEMLARFHGFFYEGHRASIDVEALVKLLQLRPQEFAPTYLAQILQYARESRYRVLAVGTPFEAKDELKQRGYNWDGERRVWWTITRQTDKQNEADWLGELYARYGCRRDPVFQKIDPTQQWA